jgi:hypothetical protein
MGETKNGDILFPRVIDKFWSRFKKDPKSGCWLWLGAINSRGYGQIRIHQYECWLTHRLSFFYTKGYIDPKRLVCHICDVRVCGNPNHLFHGTAKDNTADMMRKRGPYEYTRLP